MCITAHNLTYIHSDKEVLFENISFSVIKGQKTALIGNNGCGKSTLIQIIAGILKPASGELIRSSLPYFVPQHYGQYNHLTVAQALKVDKKIDALHAILDGDASSQNFSILDDDWNMEERTKAALSSWGLEYIELDQIMENLSGGEKTKIFLAGITIHSPNIILLDEPTNHLDYHSRQKVYDLIKNSNSTIIIISHDRILLNMLTSIYEMGKNEIAYYSGNYELYKEQKEIALNALQSKLDENIKQLRLSKKIARETLERKQKHEVRGKKSNIKKGVGKMAMDTLQDRAEKSATKLKDIHADKQNSLLDNITDLKKKLPEQSLMKTDFNSSLLHKGKILLTAKDINHEYMHGKIWQNPLSFEIRSGERIAIKGINGSGKTTLLKIITDKLTPTYGIIEKADFQYVFLDQEYSMIDDNLTVLEQITKYNKNASEDELKIILNRFLFSYETWDKYCYKLSGGEKMKLSLSCLMVNDRTPDIFILDEPTNNIDIQNIDILTATIKDYKGTVLVVSHDGYFLDEIGIDYDINL